MEFYLHLLAKVDVQTCKEEIKLFILDFQEKIDEEVILEMKACGTEQKFMEWLQVLNNIVDLKSLEKALSYTSQSSEIILRQREFRKKLKTKWTSMNNVNNLNIYFSKVSHFKTIIDYYYLLNDRYYDILKCCFLRIFQLRKFSTYFFISSYAGIGIFTAFYVIVRFLRINNFFERVRNGDAGLDHLVFLPIWALVSGVFSAIFSPILLPVIFYNHRKVLIK